MFLLDWYREFRAIRNESRICDTCEALKLELAKAHDTNRELLQVITTPKPVEVTTPADPTIFKPLTPKSHMMWSTRRQMLQAEDKAKAIAMKRQQEDSRTIAKDETKSPITPASVETDNLTQELEKELDIVGAEREAQTGVA